MSNRIMCRVLLVCAFMTLFWANKGHCDFIPDNEYKVNKLVDAIKMAENSKKYPYGIKSIPFTPKSDYYPDREKWARKICKNTIRNNVERWRKSVINGDQRDYLTFLWHRYCPPSEHGLNQNWLRNVKAFLGK